MTRSYIAALSLYQFIVDLSNSHMPLLQAALPDATGFIAVFLYAAVLVALVGRTFGMMVLGLQVVRPDFRRVGAGRAAWRYLVLFFSFASVVPVVGYLWRPPLQDRITGTRVVRGSIAP